MTGSEISKGVDSLCLSGVIVSVGKFVRIKGYGKKFYIIIGIDRKEESTVAGKAIMYLVNVVGEYENTVVELHNITEISGATYTDMVIMDKVAYTFRDLISKGIRVSSITNMYLTDIDQLNSLATIHDGYGDNK